METAEREREGEIRRIDEERETDRFQEQGALEAAPRMRNLCYPSDFVRAVTECVMEDCV